MSIKILVILSYLLSNGTPYQHNYTEFVPKNLPFLDRCKLAGFMALSEALSIPKDELSKHADEIKSHKPQWACTELGVVQNI